MFKEAGATKAWYGVLALAAMCAWFGYVGLRSLLGARRPRGSDLERPRQHGRTGAHRLHRGDPARRAVLAGRAAPDALAGASGGLGYLVLFAVVVLPLLTLVESGFATEVSQHAHFLELGRLPLGSQVVVAGLILVGIDAMNWAAHVANHRSLVLWRLHALHHSQEDMSVLTTFRTHPLIHASYLPSLFPALILGASGTVPGLAIIIYGCLITLPHANLRWTFGPLGRVFVSPAYHRLHHAANFLDDRGTVNYGFVLVCWDQMIRRAAFPDQARRPRRDGHCGPAGAHRAARLGALDAAHRGRPAGPAVQGPRGDGRPVMSAFTQTSKGVRRGCATRATRRSPATSRC